MTRGHVGACEDFLHVASYCSLKSTGKYCTYDNFITGIHMVELLKSLSIDAIFSRRLPTAAQLRDTSLAQVLWDILQEGSIIIAKYITIPAWSRRSLPSGDVLNLAGSAMKVSGIRDKLHSHLRQCYISGMFSGSYWVTWRRVSSMK